jgi:hypothetical protein
MTQDEAKQWLRNILGPPHRTLEGDEAKDILLLLALIEPFKETNNQHSWTEYYMIGDREYHVTTFPGEEPIVDLVLPE